MTGVQRTLLLALVLAGPGCGGAPTVDPLAQVSVPPLPEWTDRYAASNVGDTRFFNISKLMAGHALSRLEAVELQNHYRDLTRAAPDGDRARHFAEALARVQRGEFESGLDPKALAAAPFIIVFDLDDTLYDQYRATTACHTFVAMHPDGEGGVKPRHVMLAPGWKDAFDRIRAAGGLVVLFSANLDSTTQTNLRAWNYEGQNLLESPHIAGVLSNSHLVQQEKTEGPGAVKVTRGQPVAEPSKDMRLFDEALERVVIVDDNPTRLFQLANARVFKKFHANAACTSPDPELKAAYGAAMGAVTEEIVESAAHAKSAGVPFARAYLPYTMLGQVSVGFLMETRGWDEAKAVAYVRAHPAVVDAKF